MTSQDGEKKEASTLLLKRGSEPLFQEVQFAEKIGNTPVLLDLSLSKNRMSVAVDWLSMTASVNACKLFEMETKFIAKGGKSSGYAMSNKRMLDGQICWQKIAPYMASPKYGSDQYRYESWEFSGAQAGHAWTISLGLEMLVVGKFGDKNYEPSYPKPSRLDIAYDFECAEHETTDYLCDLMRARIKEYNNAVSVHNEKQRYKKYKIKPMKDLWYDAQLKGKRGELTFYLPFLGAPRLVRIYRKDIQNPAACDDFGVPYILRIEMEMKEDWALKAWNARKDDGHYAVAAHMVAELTGILVGSTVKGGYVGNTKEVTCEATKLFNACMQYKAMMPMWAELGIDCFEVMKRLDTIQSKTSRSNIRKKMKYINDVGVDAVKKKLDELVDEVLEPFRHEIDLDIDPKWDEEELG